MNVGTETLRAQIVTRFSIVVGITPVERLGECLNIEAYPIDAHI